VREANAEAVGGNRLITGPFGLNAATSPAPGAKPFPSLVTPNVERPHVDDAATKKRRSKKKKKYDLPPGLRNVNVLQYYVFQGHRLVAQGPPYNVFIKVHLKRLAYSYDSYYLALEG
jgi:hypothetical protein